MPNTLGYMLTWTTYGTWLQGDARGYVNNGKICSENICLRIANETSKTQSSIRLSDSQRQLIKEAILNKAESVRQAVHALTVRKDHVHLVVGYTPVPIPKIAAIYKAAARMALKEYGFQGKLWTKGYDKRFCFDAETLKRRIKYVEKHNQNI